MQQAIRKFDLRNHGQAVTQVIDMPAGARILSVQAEHGHRIVLFALCVTYANPPIDQRHFRLYETDQEIEINSVTAPGTYIGTVQLAYYVQPHLLHVFEV